MIFMYTRIKCVWKRPSLKLSPSSFNFLKILKNSLTRFNRLDLNHNGFISREDVEFTATKFQE
jgi:hypothetical protein